MALASVWLVKAIHLPSGDQAGARSVPGLVVTWVRCTPLSSGEAPAERATLSAETVQMSVLKLRSGSGLLRLLEKASDLPSGDQAGSSSSKSPEVIWVSFFEATSKT